MPPNGWGGAKARRCRVGSVPLLGVLKESGGAFRGTVARFVRRKLG